jgi:hypothetical protein
MSVGPQAVKPASKHWILILRLQLLRLECPDRYQFTWAWWALCLEWPPRACSTGESIRSDKSDRNDGNR